MPIHISLHVLLYLPQRCFYFLLYLLHPFHKLVCLFKLPLLPELESHARVLSIVCLEGRHFSTCLHLVVVDELCSSQLFWPLLLMVINEHS